ncbi:MAG: hypothetical protein ACREIW_02760, partial [Chthoniobacterales bacterium]
MDRLLRRTMVKTGVEGAITWHRAMGRSIHLPNAGRPKMPRVLLQSIKTIKTAAAWHQRCSKNAARDKCRGLQSNKPKRENSNYMLRTINKRRGGFTLVEIMIV